MAVAMAVAMAAATVVAITEGEDKAAIIKRRQQN